MPIISFYGNFQPKVLEHIHKDILVANPYLKSKVKDRIYSQNLSNIENPKYPCITFFRSGMGADTSIGQIDTLILTIEIWSKLGPEELWSIYAAQDPTTGLPAGVRGLLSDKTFDFTEVSIGKCREVWISPDMYSKWNRAYFLSSRYILNCAGKTLVIP